MLRLLQVAQEWSWTRRISGIRNPAHRASSAQPHLVQPQAKSPMAIGPSKVQLPAPITNAMMATNAQTLTALSDLGRMDARVVNGQLAEPLVIQPSVILAGIVVRVASMNALLASSARLAQLSLKSAPLEPTEQTKRVRLWMTQTAFHVMQARLAPSRAAPLSPLTVALATSARPRRRPRRQARSATTTTRHFRLAQSRPLTALVLLAALGTAPNTAQACQPSKVSAHRVSTAHKARLRP